MGMRDALLILGGLLILGVLAHGAWIAWRARRASLRVRYERNIPNLDLDDIDLLRAELPSGGARIVSRSETPRRAGEDEQPVPVLLDPIDQELDAADATEPVPEPGRQGRSAPKRRARAPEPVAEPDPEPEPEPEAEPESDAVEPRPTGTGTEDTAEQEPAETGAQSEPEQAPLFAGDPIVARDRGERGGRRRTAAETRKPAREKGPATREEDQPEREEPEIEDVLVVNVLRREGDFMPGSDLLEVVSEHGLRYGDMNIFHRYGAGQRIDFSMANAVKPGTFDLGAIDELRTPGVTFFMRLPGPDQPLEAFDDLANVARDMAKRLDAELKDERHSVMTAQTLEHCRQRIREFRRRQMSRRS
ncbi:MAG: cell division protein ZipA [Gammaproteobacteria bacterium]|nr:cell division protein ZipA [Gammaproteobacteria bacterium]